MRLLVIGARGFIGAHVRGEATTAGLEVVTASRSGLDGSPRHARADLAQDSPAAIAALIDDVAPDAVVNCAGATAGDPAQLLAANVTSVYTLVTAMLSARVPVRLVHLGSAAEYGPATPGVAVTEQSVARPVALYGATKLAGTQLVDIAITAGLDAVVLRVFNPVGPGAPAGGLPGRLAAELRRALRDGGDIHLGPVDAVRDFIDVRDVADAVIAAAQVPKLPHRLLNIGTGHAVPAQVLVRQLLAISGWTGVVREDSAGSPRTPHLSWQEADITCAVEDLGWKPCRDLTASLAALWEASH
ncbi:MAG TPA: NAD-dependent epimerase/dehydratase family protein [Trebonia sp.]|jgi:nucleoside-diphosphate-sugar epimerase|nr:NAD-dependent epimerase/dehydratase family protein [Trebonia sp.]